MNKKKIIYQLHWKLILRDLWFNAWLILLAGLIGVMSVFIYDGMLRTPTYSSTVTMAVSPRVNGSYVGFYSSLNTANEMAEVFQEVFTSDVLKRMVKEDLQNPGLAVNVSAEVEEGTNILRVTSIAATPLASYEVINAVMDNYGEVSEYLFGNVVLDTIKSPHIPTEESNAVDMPFWCTLMAGVSMLLMTALILLLSVMRNTVKTLGGAKHHLGEAPLGVLIHEKSVKKGKRRQKGLLIWRSTVSFHYTEALLQVAHKIRHRLNKANQKVLLVTSVAENEGKSTVAANLAVAMARHGQRVALVDLDLRRPAVHKLFSEQGNCIDLRTAVEEGEIPHTDANPLVFVSSGATNPGALFHDSRFAALMNTLRSDMDYVILDSAPYTAVADTGMVLRHADACVMVVRQDWVPYRVLRDVAKDLDEGRADYMGYVLNDYVDNGALRQSHNSYKAYE